jgi:hypothetical protein
MLIIIIIITKVMSSYGRVIGFDNISYRYSNLGHINFLIGTRHDKFIKELTTLNLKGIDYHINVKESNPLYCPVFEAIEYNCTTRRPLILC